MSKNSEEKTNSFILNAFSIDVEGFVESNVQSFQVPKEYIDPQKENDEIERNTNAILEILEESSVKATFFFLGRLARDIPHLIEQVAQSGHEIGCHNYLHLRIFGIDKNEFKDKITAAKKDLEDVSGKQIFGFRAPDFSITQSSMWALDILKETGFVYDSSIYPFGLHDVYGIKDANPSIHRLPNGLIEFPLSTTQMFGKTIPFGGGGYFRLYPFTLTCHFLSKLNKQGLPAMFYIHPYELGPVIPKIPGLSSYRRFRHYYNCKNGKQRVKQLLNSFKFTTAIQVLKKRNLLEN